MSRRECIYNALKELSENITIDDLRAGFNGFDATTIGLKAGISRSNSSKELNILLAEGKVVKVSGKPVYYMDKIKLKEISNTTILSTQLTVSSLSSLLSNKVKVGKEKSSDETKDAFDNIIGADGSLKVPINQAKAAILYPPKGLHTLLIGPTGVGKSTFAEMMHRYAMLNDMVNKNSEFVIFNCAEYAENPNLLLSQLFGYVKGAFTGADRDKDGLIDRANGGIILLDEIHRLPAEGQEMLFLVMDKGTYRKLGETENTRQADVLLICATTEDINSSLLNTFLRRIPMIIRIPSLSERTLSERFQIIKQFFYEESKFVKVPIKIHKDVIKAFLLYNCKGNIGQLKADIQLTCAGGFLDYKTYMKKQIEIEISSIPEHVYEGLLNLKEKRNKMPILFEIDYHKYYEFSDSANTELNLRDDYHTSSNLYDEINEKYELYAEMGYKQLEINEMLNNHIRKYLNRLLIKCNNEKKSLSTEELFKIISPKIYYAVELALNKAEQKLNRKFSKKVYIALAMHISALLEHITEGKRDINSEINKIALERPNEFKVAKLIRLILQEELDIKIPEEEIGFITMFLYSVDSDLIEENKKLGIIVLCHGKATASSMAEVANALLETNHCKSIDMALDLKVNDVLEITTNLVREVDEGKGVLILVDMGSLVTFSEMITKKTSINTRCVEMVSTPMVIEAVRKSLMLEMTLERLADELQKLNPYMGRLVVNSIEGELLQINTRTIITTCLTGDGAAVKLADLLKRYIPAIDEFNIDIKPMNIDKFKSFNTDMDNKNILAVVGTVDLKLRSIPYIPIDDVVLGTGLNKIEELITGVKTLKSENDEEAEISLVINTISEGLEFLNPAKAYKVINISFEKIKYLISMDNYYRAKIGYILHCSFMVERCLKRQAFPYNNIKQLIRDKFSLYCELKDAMIPLEESFSVEIPDTEIGYLIDLIDMNSLSNTENYGNTL